MRRFFLSTQDESKLIVNYAFLSGGLYFFSFPSPRKYCYEDNGSNLNALRSSLFKILKSILQTNAYEKFEYKGIKTVWVTDYTTQTPSKHFCRKNTSVQHPSKMRKYSWNVHKKEVRVPTVREKSVKNEKSSRSGKSQEILSWVREIWNFGKSQGKVREFYNTNLSYFWMLIITVQLSRSMCLNSRKTKIW